MEVCETWAGAVSAMADGEDPGVDPALVDAHIRRCSACRALRASLQAPRDTATAPSSGPAPGLAREVVDRVGVADRAAAPPWMRSLLALLAAQILVLATPALVLGDDGVSSPHDARHLGAFSIAYAVGLLLVVQRPARARTLLVVGQVLAAAVVLSSVVDVLQDTISLRTELLHLPELLSVPVLWRLASGHARPVASGRS